jgi:hypothetical protein
MVPPLAMTSDHRVVTCQIRCDAVAMSWLTPVLFVVGVAALLVGAEGLVRGASRVALRTGLSPVVIGLTVVAFGTSAPELAVSLGDAVGGSGDLALGNVVGSNIANILLVLGLSALVGGGLSVALRIVRIDVPIMIVVSAAVLVMALDHRLGRVDGIILVAVLIAYLWWTVTGARRASGDEASSEALGDYADALTPERLRATPVWRDLMYVAGGLGLLVVGAQFLVSAASSSSASPSSRSAPRCPRSRPLSLQQPAVNAIWRSVTRLARTYSTCSPFSESPRWCLQCVSVTARSDSTFPSWSLWPWPAYRSSSMASKSNAGKAVCSAPITRPT